MHDPPMDHLIALMPPVVIAVGVLSIAYKLVIGSADKKRIDRLLAEQKALNAANAPAAPPAKKKK
jgi:hypothetical protein